MLSLNAFEKKNPTQIVENAVVHHSTWHFFQSRSWLDYVKREQKPSAIHYAAFELRYGLEYLLFELLVLISGSLTEEEYNKCVADRQRIEKLLRGEKNYLKHMEFLELILRLQPIPGRTIRIWSIKEILGYWGIASSYLHFAGVHSR